MELVSKVSILEGVDCTLTHEDLRVMVYISFATGKNNGFPFLDILGYLTHSPLNRP